MRRRIFTLFAVVGLLTGTLALPAPGAIHEIVASHCAGHDLPNQMANVDPPGQVKFGTQSFLRALQATGVYDIRFGESQEGVPGLDLTTGDPTAEPPIPPDFGPMPGPVADTEPITILVDNTKPSAKLGDSFVWGFIPIPDLGITVYLQLYDLNHPAFEHCTNLHP